MPIKFQMRAAANGAGHMRFVFLDTEAEVPRQKCFGSLLNFAVNDKPWIMQRNLHRGEDVLN